MKILMTGYYDDYARFFNTLEESIKVHDRNISVLYVSFFLSGWLYKFFKFKNVTLVSFKVLISIALNKKKYNTILGSSTKYKGVDLVKVSSYHSGFITPEEKQNILILAMAYVDVYESLLDQFRPDLIISSDDSRVFVETLLSLAKQRNIKIQYFEQGPFGTTLIDSCGVTANACFANSEIEKVSLEKISKIQEFFLIPKHKRYRRFPFYRGMDYVYSFIQRLFERVVPVNYELLSPKKSKVSRAYKSLKNRVINSKIFKHTFLLILQVPDDVNFINHSPNFSNSFQMLKEVHEALPLGSKLIVREHPLLIGGYEEELYVYVLANSNIFLESHKPLIEQVRASNVVCVNNSTVGFDVIKELKPLVVLGDAVYDLGGFCLKYDQLSNVSLAELVELALTLRIDQHESFSFLYSIVFMKHYIGHFRDEDLLFVDEIAIDILTGLGYEFDA